MSKERTYTAQFKTGAQISPDDWSTYYPSLKINDNTTIGEIKEWFGREGGGQYLSVRIIELHESDLDKPET